MTILQDVRFVNASRAGRDCYNYCYWILLPAWKLAVRIQKTDGWAPEKWWSSVFDKPNEHMPADVYSWFSGLED